MRCESISLLFRLAYLLTHEPGGTPLGRKLRYWLKSSEGEMSPLVELLLFNASRAQLVDRVIGPGLKEGQIVICDRYDDSTTTYQSYGRGLDLAMVRSINTTATRGLQPDLTILLDMPPEKGLPRKKNCHHDRFEQEDIAFHRRVRRGYLTLAEEEPQRWLVIDASQPRGKIAETIWQRVRQLISR